MKTWMELGLAVVVVAAWLGVSLVADGALGSKAVPAQVDAPATVQAAPARAERQPG